LLGARVITVSGGVQHLALCPTLTTRRAGRSLLLAAALVGFGPIMQPLPAQGDPAALRALADSGDPEALNSVGSAFANGQGVAQDLAEALRYCRQAAERGHGAAQFNLGMAHELGRGAPVDLTVAFAHYLKSGQDGFAPAQFNVGNM